MQVGVVGGSGYAGGELLRLLAGHPVFKVRVVAGGARAGSSLAEAVPQLRGLDLPERLAPAEVGALEGCDVVFLATPHEVSLALAPALLDNDVTVVDLSAAFRLPAATLNEWYGLTNPTPQLAPAPYGLPELFRDALPGARLVAVPGCYPTSALLALAPLAGLAAEGGAVITGMSGTSGAGRALRDDLQASHASANAVAYGAPRHRHTPEIEAGWARLTGRAAAVAFTPHLLPTARGLICTASVPLARPAEAADLQERFAEAYAGERFVHVLPPGQWPATTHVAGGNAASVGFAFDPRTSRVTTSCAIDNLGKGAAGQAVQAANAALGLPETAGLSPAGVYP